MSEHELIQAIETAALKSCGEYATGNAIKLPYVVLELLAEYRGGAAGAELREVVMADKRRERDRLEDKERRAAERRRFVEQSLHREAKSYTPGL